MGADRDFESQDRIAAANFARAATAAGVDRIIFLGSSGNSVLKSKLLVFGGSLLPGATILNLPANGRIRQERPTQKRGTEAFHIALHIKA